MHERYKKIGLKKNENSNISIKISLKYIFFTLKKKHLYAIYFWQWDTRNLSNVISADFRKALLKIEFFNETNNRKIQIKIKLSLRNVFILCDKKNHLDIWAIPHS